MAPPRAPTVEELEGRLTAVRLLELHGDPVRGRFDVAHLREVHRRIFQDLPHHGPGEFRPDAPGHFKMRTIRAAGIRDEIGYPPGAEVAERLERALAGDVVSELRGADRPRFAARVAQLYSDLDYAHGFREGNSRTLREFTRELALAAGHKIDWETISQGDHARDLLYLARDREVFLRAFPGIGDRHFQPADRVQHEAHMIVRHVGKSNTSLEQLLANAHREHASDRAPTPSLGEPDLDR